ncbi:MAG TPA: hypothetical protein VGB85_15520 [Nannocystis sp.]
MLRLALAWHLARAQVPEPPDLPIAGIEWSAPSGCPGRADLLAAISRRLGRELAPDELALDARVVRVGSRHALRLRVVVGDRSELRELDAEACTPLVDATALLVVHTLAEVASEPAPTDREPLPPVVDAPVPDVAPAPVAAPPPAIAPPPVDPPRVASPSPAPRPRGPGVLLRAHGGPELGAAPRWTGLAGLAVGLLWPRLRLEARASFLGPRSVTRVDTEVTALLLAGSLHACARLGRGALELPLCAGLEAGGMRGAAYGPAAGRSAFMPWLGVVLGVGAAWRVRPRLALWSALEVVGGVVRPNFVLRGRESDIALFRPFPLSGRLLVGLELRLRDPR